MRTTREKTLKRVLFVCALLYGITLVYGFYRNYMLQDWQSLAMGMVAVFTPLIVPLLFRLFHWKPVYEIYIISTIFVYFASLIGSSFHGYALPFFDKALHFSSGMFLLIAAVMLFLVIRKSNQIKNREELHMFIVFINAVNIAAAFLWELYEYALLIFFDNDAINHYTSGVHDSITDMICAALGGLLITWFIVRYYKSGKANFFTNVYEKFYEYNIKNTL